MDYKEKAFQQPKIRVVIRKRPLNKKQLAKNESDVAEVLNNNQIIVREQKVKVDLTRYTEEHQFKFDYALDQDISNQEMYNQCVKPIVQCAFMGAKVTCFAYGQTGSGKTYTMNGDADNGVLGMYFLGADDIFTLRDSQYQHLDVYVSFYQIYCGKLFDLLNGREQLQAREDAKQNVNIIGLTVKKVSNTEEFMETISCGSSVRITSQNSTNADSSRSHAIMQIDLKQGKKNAGKITFIDLAGCQRGADTMDQNKQTKIDGAEINKSLLALKQCIRALDQAKNHTPFRGSKLTMVLKDSFTGFCKTLMIGNISPGSGSCENTLNTLRYADRVKELKKGGNQEPISKEQRLAKQLMLPRNGKAKIIMVNESDQQQEKSFVNKQKNQNISSGPLKKFVPEVMKKPKYIFKDENEKTKVNFTQNLNQNIRKNGISNTTNVHVQPLKSVNNAVRRQDIQRNKSVIGRQKSSLVSNNSWMQNRPIENAMHSQRNSFVKNTSNIIMNKECNNKEWPNREHKELFNKDLRNIDVKIKQQTNNNQYLSKIYECQSQWDKAVESFKHWSPSHHNFAEMSQLFEEMVKMIMKEELQITEMHKNILIKEEKYHKEMMLLYQETQIYNKNNEEMHDYARRLSKNIEKKLEAGVQLKMKAQLYQQHLREHEFCELRLIEAGDMLEGCQTEYTSVQCGY